MTRLALEGGTPVRSEQLPLFKPSIDQSEIQAVAETLASGWIAQGTKVQEFEEKFAAYVGVRHAIAVSSGTTALHLAVKALNVSPGDPVICPSFTFVATANAILYERGKPVFVDIDKRTFNLNANAAPHDTWRQAAGVIVVHYAGFPADMDAIRRKTAEHDLFLIEDAAEAHGAVYKGKKAGAMGDIGVFSFYPTKAITTGEGGMITTNSDALAERCISLRNHGRVGRHGFSHIEMGYNYRMTDIQGAIGSCQVDKLDSIIAAKRHLAHELTERITGVAAITPPYENDDCLHPFQLYTIRIDQDVVGCSRDHLMEALRAEGIDTNVYYHPAHLQPHFREMGYAPGINPIAEACGESVLSLPLFPSMELRDVKDVCDALDKVLSNSNVLAETEPRGSA